MELSPEDQQQPVHSLLEAIAEARIVSHSWVTTAWLRPISKTDQDVRCILIDDLSANGDRLLIKNVIVCYRGEAQSLFHDGY